MAKSFRVYTGEYGKTLRLLTYLSTIGSASAIVVRFKKDDGTTVAYLTAAADGDDTTTYAVEAVITSGWLTGKAGRWTGQVEATFATGKFYSDPFTMIVDTTPSV